MNLLVQLRDNRNTEMERAGRMVNLINLLNYIRKLLSVADISGD